MIPYRKTVWASSIFLFIAGCGGGNGGNPDSGPGNAASQAVLLRGHVHGGQSPVASSAVTLYTVNPGAAASVVTTAQTDSKGDFTLNFTCSSPGLSISSLLYITSNGGNPGGGNNNALSEMVALGACGSLPAFADITEVTTVAATYALSGFMTVSGTAPNLSVNVQASATNSTGLANAFATAAVLANPATGLTPASLNSSQAAAEQKINTLANSVAACVNTTGGGSAQCTELFACAVPGAAFDGTSACSGGTGTASSNTIGAALSVVHNAGLVSAAGIYDTATRNAVFSPALGGAPNDWALALSFTNSAVENPEGLAIDAFGNIWTTGQHGPLNEFNPVGVPILSNVNLNGGSNFEPSIAIDASSDVWVLDLNSVYKLDSGGTQVPGSPFPIDTTSYFNSISIDASGDAWILPRVGNSVVELNSAGSPVAASPITGGGLSYPEAIAIDPAGAAWVLNTESNDVTKISSDGSIVKGSPFNGSGSLNNPGSLAIDSSGDVWIANSDGSNIVELDSSGAPVSGSPFSAGGLYYPRGIAIDAAGDVWVANSNSSIAELNSSGAPLSGNSGFKSASFEYIDSIAIDASGNVWAVGFRANNFIELVGAAAPTRTPLVATITPGKGFSP